jgi:hypothetical protein
MSRVIQVAIRDGLKPDMWDESGFIRESGYTMLFWCAIPDDWCSSDSIREEKKSLLLNRILDGLYSTSVAGDWRMGNKDGSLFVVLSQEVNLLSDVEIAAQPWKAEKEGFRNWSCYVVNEGGQMQHVECQDFTPNVLPTMGMA